MVPLEEKRKLLPRHPAAAGATLHSTLSFTPPARARKQKRMSQTETPEKETGEKSGVTSTEVALALISAFETTVQKIGLPATIFACVFSFVVWYASPDQKRAIIDLYL